MLTVQAWVDGGLTQHSGQRDEEKPTGSGYMLEVEGIGVDSRLKMVNREEGKNQEWFKSSRVEKLDGKKGKA